MGLDITAYRGLIAAKEGEGRDPVYHDEADWDNGWFKLYPNADFPDRADDLTHGIYRAAEKFAFRAGSYSGYSAWRDQLAELAGVYAATAHPGQYAGGRMSHAAGAWNGNASEGPFFELINFSDCEGVIGPRTSAKLAADFAAFQLKADAHSDEWFRITYADWRKAFEMASDNGAVDFH